VQAGFAVLPLYLERYVLVAPAGGAQDGAARERVAHDETAGTLCDAPASTRWDAICDLPLCLLGDAMQNRQVINAAFRRAGVQPSVVLEADSMFALYSTVRHARLASVLPHSLPSALEPGGSVRSSRRLPEITREIGLIARSLPALSPLVSAVWQSAQACDLQQHFDALLRPL
jgi:DNA-binding transcriptional LysR family regulator